MKLRLLQFAGIAAFVIVLSQMMGTVAGQAPNPGQNGPAPKTSWGEPDLMGIWTINYQVPLERPDKYKDKAFFTEAEIAELDRERQTKPQFGEKRAERGTERDVAGAYDSAVFLMRRHTGRRTSLIVDPPNGRIPPVTPEVQKRRAEIRS